MWGPVGSRVGRARVTFASMRFVGLFLVLGLPVACDWTQTETQAQRGPPKKNLEEFSGEEALAHVQAMVDSVPATATELSKDEKTISQTARIFGWKVNSQVSRTTLRAANRVCESIATFAERIAHLPSRLLALRPKEFDTLGLWARTTVAQALACCLNCTVLAQRPDLARK